jgi:hypothetical protein
VTVQLPASWVSHAYETPTCCARHGNPATLVRRVRILRQPPAWLAAAGGAFIAVVVMILSEKVLAPAWPFCDECRHERALRLTVGAALCGAAPLPYCAMLATAPIAGFSGVGLGATVFSVIASVVLLLGGLAFAVAAAWQTLCGAFVSRDGQWILVGRPHQAFADQVAQSIANAPDRSL